MIQMPPRSGKSMLANKYFAAWHQGHFGDRNLILTSATDPLAQDFSAGARDVLIEHGLNVFGREVRHDFRASHRWGMVGGGTCQAAGIGGDIMGRGADGLVIDDFFKNVDEALSETMREKLYKWYLSTASSRLSPDAWIIIIATRWHRHDLMGRLLEDAKAGGDAWCQLRLPCLAEENDPLGRAPGEPLWPERFPLEWCLGVKNKYVAAGYEWMWEALYQQNPPEVLDSEFSAEYFPESMWFTDWPTEVVHRVQTCDPSLGASDKSDYQAHVLNALDRNGVMWIDADLQRRDRVQLVGDMLDLSSYFHPEAIGVEAQAFQILLSDELHRQSQARGLSERIWPIINTENKLLRIRATLTPHLSRHEFRFRDTPGTRLLVEQLKGFPSCKYDDGPDALEMSVRLMHDLFNASMTKQTITDDQGEDLSYGVLL